MTPRKPPSTKHNLFPDTWVIGTAAAALAKNDVGVLLADDPDHAAAPAPVSTPVPVTPLHEVATVEPRRSIEEELAELRAENERLRRCIAGSRGDLDAINWEGDPEGPSAPHLYLASEPRRLHRRPGRMHQVLIAGALTLALGGFVAAWFAGQRLTMMDGPWVERIDTLRADITGTVAGLGERVVAWVRPEEGDRRIAPVVSVTPSQN